MIFIDFGLLGSPYCKISCLLTLRYVLKFDNLHMIMAKFGNVFIERLQTLFYFFLHFFYFFNVFYFYLKVYCIYAMNIVVSIRLLLLFVIW